VDERQRPPVARYVAGRDGGRGQRRAVRPLACRSGPANCAPAPGPTS
jgi:hypothetical protein